MAGLAGTAQAIEVGDTCQVNPGGNVYPNYSSWYIIFGSPSTVGYPDSIVVDSLDGGYYYVHKAGVAGATPGYIVADGINFSTCHQ